MAQSIFSMYRFSILFIFFISASFNVAAQDLVDAKKAIKTLTSKKYWGRGYTKNGMAKAANFIENKMKSFGLSPLTEAGFKQYFNFSANTFPSKMELKINGKKLRPGKDFIVHQASKGVNTSDSLTRKDSVTYANKNGGVVVGLAPKLTWSASQKVLDYTVIEVAKRTDVPILKKIDVHIENEFVTNFTAANVMAMVKGTTKPDSVIVFTAHYDHLGGMGNKTYFPGANDNASGVAMLLDLAKYYAKNPPKYSVVFIAFAAEEIGLLGSKILYRTSFIST
ncbi:M28 family peptidase [Pedobacter sp. SL55]|nr:M28 family peptidase [Pedobacter sp. SL55]